MAQQIDTNPYLAAAMYKRWAPDRDHYVRRARQCANLTIPSLFPPEGFNATSDLPTPWQGIGERGVRNLGSRLLLTTLPVSAPLLKLGLAPVVAAQAKALGSSQGDFDDAFSAIEQGISDDVEAAGSRVPMFGALKQLLVAGNVLLHYRPDGSLQYFRLDSYVVRRDASGKSRTIIVHRRVDRDSLDPTVRAACGVDGLLDTRQDTDKVDLYTVITRSDATREWLVHQEINDKLVPGSMGSDPLESPSWVAARMVAVEGEHYGRSYVEELLGDLTSYDALNRHMIEGAAAMAKLLFMRRPGAATREADLKKANLSIITGNPDDVTVLRLDKFGDFRVALELSRDIRERLEQSFLLTSSVQRDAERVTAEEVRLMASELDEGLGGIYTTLAHEVQRPYVLFLMRRAQRQGRVPPELMDRSKVRLILTTGIQALGRGADLTKLRGALGDLAQLAQVAQSLPQLNLEEATKRVFASWGVEMKDLIRSPEEVQAEQANAQAMQLATSPAAGQAVRAATQPTA